MYVKIRKLFAKPDEGDVIVNISKRALIQDLRKIIFDETKVDPSKQRLFYKGKQLSDDHKIMDYDIQLNDVIQLMIKIDVESENKTFIDENKNCEKSISSSNMTEPSSSRDTNKLKRETSKYYKIEDAIDALDTQFGAWFEARIIDILKRKDSEPDKSNEEPDIIFRIKMESETGNVTSDVSFNEIRPRATYTYTKSELSVGQTILANYNVEHTSTRGYWYDFVIEKINYRNLKGYLLVGEDRTRLENCTIKFIDETKQIEKAMLIKDRPKDYNSNLPPLRKTIYYCEKCKDDANKSCKNCGCSICSGKDEPDTIILCDECDVGYHIKCLTPPLLEIPPEGEDWYCPSCKIDENEIVKAGDKLKHSTKKAKMASAKEESTSRDWGRGMACVGRTKECTIVPKNHYGPIPGVDVGTCWKYRVQVSESGVHRPHVAGIHGRESDGAYSLILSGGYEDDIDNGHEFIYTGSGGRDLSGNKRVSDQSCDQVLSRMNRALALNCNVSLNKNGAEAKSWKAGKPVRVVRNYKINKFSKYGPKDGNRYDGIYKVVKYYPEKGKSGFLVWKYLLRRDDPEPAPWEKGGQELEMLYPPGYLEAQAAKISTSPNRAVKRKRSASNEESKKVKKNKVVPFKMSEKIAKTIKSDDSNTKLWNECRSFLKFGKQAFLSKVEELFMCICCQEVVHLPVSTECKHNVCKACLLRSFSAEIFNCPYCRFELGKDYKITVNENLSAALLGLFPGYEANR